MLTNHWTCSEVICRKCPFMYVTEWTGIELETFSFSNQLGKHGTICGVGSSVFGLKKVTTATLQLCYSELHKTFRRYLSTNTFLRIWCNKCFRWLNVQSSFRYCITFNGSILINTSLITSIRFLLAWVASVKKKFCVQLSVLSVADCEPLSALNKGFSV